MKISLLVAATENNIIGKDNALIWHLPRDLGFFKKLTMNKMVLSGRKTFESLGKPLPGRKHLVVSSNFETTFDDVKVFRTIESAIDFAKSHQTSELMVIGGGEIYRYFIENGLADVIYLTRVHARLLGDTRFPVLDPTEWKIISKVSYPRDAKNKLDMSFCKYVKLG